MKRSRLLAILLSAVSGSCGGGEGSRVIDASLDTAIDAASADSRDDASAGHDGHAGVDVPPATEWPPTTVYQVKSDMLTNPEATGRAMAKSCADFWKKAQDAANGGYYTFVDRQGVVTANHGKSFVCQGRLGAAFSRAFMLTGDETYLDHARSALDFLYAHGWDQTNGGWFFTADELGNVLSGADNTSKWSFIQHYNIMGSLAMCEATADQTDCGWADKGRTSLEKMWDSNPSSFGFFNYATNDFGSFTGKGFTPTVDALGAHALHSYLLTGASTHRERALALSENVLGRMVASLDRPDRVFGFAEEFDTNWNVDTLKTSGYTGHVFKAAWQMARVYMMAPEAKYRDGARRLLHTLWDEGGFDKTNGAPNDTFKWDTGLSSTNKDYWQVEQGFMAGITAFFIENSAEEREIDLEIADRSIDFLSKHFMDSQYGGMYFKTNTDGSQVINTAKSDKYEAGHHCVETGYYGYLYGNLLYRRQPVSLYYRLAPTAATRQIRLSPLTMDDTRLRIESVELDGKAFTGFDAQSRTVTLPAGTGGKLKVTFRPVY